MKKTGAGLGFIFGLKVCIDLILVRIRKLSLRSLMTNLRKLWDGKRRRRREESMLGGWILVCRRRGGAPGTLVYRAHRIQAGILTGMVVVHRVSG
jgi:hypothetical protein